MISEAMGYNKNEMCIFGDRLYTDIALRKKFCVTAVLVLSGETKANNVDTASPQDRPDFAFDLLADVDKEIFG